MAGRDGIIIGNRRGGAFAVRFCCTAKGFVPVPEKIGYRDRREQSDNCNDDHDLDEGETLFTGYRW